MKAKPTGLKFCDLSHEQIDELAWENKPLPAEAHRSHMIYYHLVRSLYGCVKYGGMSIADAKTLKLNLAHYYDQLEALALSSGKLLCELGKLTAPRTDIKNKSREELIEIITKMDALCCGFIKSASENVPEFITDNRRIDNG